MGGARASTCHGSGVGELVCDPSVSRVVLYRGHMDTPASVGRYLERRRAERHPLLYGELGFSFCMSAQAMRAIDHNFHAQAPLFSCPPYVWYASASEAVVRRLAALRVEQLGCE